MLKTLYGMGIKSLMVEGGASVIASFLDSRYVDRLLITISPTFVGSAGVTYECSGEQVSWRPSEWMNDFL
jgi:riboflavin biosynthesis pyrimidine reductase